MKHVFYLLAIIFFTCPLPVVYGQVKYFVQGGGNLSVITTQTNTGTYVDIMADNPNRSDIKTSSNFKHKPGLGINAGAKLKANQLISIEGTIGLAVINYRQKNRVAVETVNGSQYSSYKGTYYNAGLTYPLYWVQNPGGFYATEIGENAAPKTLQKKQGNVSIGVITIGALVNVHITPKTNIGIGPSGNITMWAKTYNEKVLVFAESPGGQMFMRTPMTTKAGIKKDVANIMVNADFQVVQQLTNKFSLQASFTQAINKLYKSNNLYLPGGNTRMRYLSLGIRYYLN